MNVVVLQGVLSRAPEERELPSGDRLVAYEVTVRTVGQPTDSVPVAWVSAPARATAMHRGDEVVVTGRVRRRFFRTPGGTASRTEVVADAVLPASQSKRVARLLAGVREQIIDRES
jgi:single-strand DNA-binding protein